MGHLRVVFGREATDGAAVHNVDAEHPHKGAKVEQPTQRDAAGVVPLAFSHLRRKSKGERLQKSGSARARVSAGMSKT